MARKAGRRKTAARAAASKAAARTVPPKASSLEKAAAIVRGVAVGVVAAVQERLPWGSDANDPVALLESDHRRFEDLLASGVKTTQRSGKRRTQLLTTIAAELNVHELLEERVLYPALQSHKEANEIVLEGYQEHHVADLVLEELGQLPTDDPMWGAKFKVLKENIEHHIEEEERIMFRIARGILKRPVLRELGVRMKALRAELTA